MSTIRTMSFAAFCISASASLAFPYLADAMPENPEMYLYSTEDGGGDLTADYPFQRAIPVEESICIGGSCLFVAPEPGFVTDDEGQAVPDGMFFVKNALPFRLTLVAADPGVSLKLGAVILDTPGQFVNLGLSPFHAHVTYQLQLPEGDSGTYSMTIRFTTQSSKYDDSPDYVLSLSNDDVATTTTSSSTSTTATTSTSSTTSTVFTTTTLLGPVCSDGFIDDGEECDDGDKQWNAGEYCRADCTALGCGDTNDTAAVEATDALFVLQGSIGVRICEACVCDVDASGGATPVSASDALRVLRKSVDAGIQLMCPACP